MAAPAAERAGRLSSVLSSPPEEETVTGRYLITSALSYINGIKHLRNLAGSMLPADVHARFRWMQGHEVLFICAIDKHGTPAELAPQVHRLSGSFRVEKGRCRGE